MWSKASKSHVAHMTKGDFYATEKSVIIPEATTLKIELIKKDDNTNKKVLKENLKIQKNEVIDASCLHVKELKKFLTNEINDAHKEQMLFSVHLKATMMKISDPIIFGYVVTSFFQPIFDKYSNEFKELGVNQNNGFNDLLTKIQLLPEITKQEILNDIEKCYENRPYLAMVDSAKGITNLHTPSDVIVDASMPVVIRDSGKMWNKDNELEDVKCVIPDRSYALMYQEIMSYCKLHGQFDVSTMGNVANVGLMAQKAEEYGSHDKTFEIPYDGTVNVIDENNNIIFTHEVETGDIWRM